MPVIILESHSQEQTRKIGRFLGERILSGTVITLNGELGAGKTVLAKGVGEGLGIKKAITSPSFVLMNIYHGRFNFYHFDFYRLEEEEELGELGLEEYFYDEGVVLVEWADKFIDSLPATRLDICIEKSKDNLENGRILYFIPQGKFDLTVLEELESQCFC